MAENVVKESMHISWRKRLFARSSATQRRRFTRSRAGNIMYTLFILAAGLFSVVPMVYSIITSFKPLDELLLFPPRFFVQRPTLENYLVLPKLLSNLSVPLSRYIFNSVFVSISTTFLYVLVASMSAFVISKSNIKGRKFLFMVIQFVLLFNSYTLGVPQYLIFSWTRLIDTYWIYILPSLPSTMGVFLMKQYMDGCIPDTLLQAAKIDGAGHFRIFWGIVVPMVKPAIMTLTLFAFRDSWAAAPGDTIFKEQYRSLQAIMGQVASGGVARAGSAMAVTVIMMIPPILVYLVTQSNIMETMSSAGIKE